MTTSKKPRTIDEAVEDGSLVDISDLGKRFGLRCRAFISLGLFAKTHAVSPIELEIMIRFIAGAYNSEIGYNVFGQQDLGDRYRILEPHSKYGLVLLIIEKDFDIERTTGETFVLAN